MVPALDYPQSVSFRLSAGNIPQPQHLGIEHRRVARPQARATPLLPPPERVMLHGERDAGAQEVRQRARSPVLAYGAGGTLQREAARDGAPALRKRTLSREGLQGAGEPVQGQEEVQGAGAAVERPGGRFVSGFLQVGTDSDDGK